MKNYRFLIFQCDIGTCTGDEGNVCSEDKICVCGNRRESCPGYIPKCLTADQTKPMVDDTSNGHTCQVQYLLRFCYCSLKSLYITHIKIKINPFLFSVTQKWIRAQATQHLTSASNVKFQVCSSANAATPKTRATPNQIFRNVCYPMELLLLSKMKMQLVRWRVGYLTFDFSYKLWKG